MKHLAIALLLLCPLSAVAQPPRNYPNQCEREEWTAVQIHNSGCVGVRYQLRGQGGVWGTFIVHPGEVMCHWSRYRERHFEIVFDGIRNGDRAYKLETRITDDKWEGEDYVFRFSKCGCYLDIFRAR